MADQNEIRVKAAKPAAWLRKVPMETAPPIYSVCTNQGGTHDIGAGDTPAEAWRAAAERLGIAVTKTEKE